MSYNGWMLPDTERVRILALFPPKYANAKATHVTLGLDSKEIPQDAEIVAYAYVDDGAGIEALIVQVDGEIRRPDGETFHMTLSVADGRASKESNDVIKAYAREDLERDVVIATRAFMTSGKSYVTTPLSRRA